MNPKKLISIVFLLLGLTSSGQHLNHVGNDSRVVLGALPNGLSYYLMPNKTVPGYADFILVQKTVPLAEDRSHAGIFPDGEYTSLTSMYNFRDAEFFTFLDDMGVAAKKGFKVNTLHDYTTYEFSNIALQRNSSVVDSMLLAILNLTYPLRPDRQAVVIVGDINTSSVIAKMQTLFQIIPKPGEPYEETDTENIGVEPEGRFSYVTDIEADRATLTYDYALEPIAEPYRTTAVPFIYDFYIDIVTGILSERCNRELAGADFLPLNFRAELLPLMGRNTLRITMQCAPEDYVDAHEFLESMIERIRRFGLTEEEVRRETDKVFSRVEDRYRERKVLPNSYFAQQCVRNFAEGYSIVGPEFRKAYIGQVKDSIGREMMEEFISKLLDPEKKHITCSAPIPTGGLEYFRIETMPLEPDSVPLLRVSVPETEEEKFFKKIFVNKSTGVVSRRLSNGAVMAYKPLQDTNEWIYFEAFAPGGISLLDHELLKYSEHIENVARLCKIKGQDIFQRVQTNNAMNIEIDRKINIEDRRITGKFHKSYIHEFMQLVNDFFQGSDPDEVTFEKYRKMKMSSIPYKNNSPQRVLDGYASNDVKIRETGPAVSDSMLLADMDYSLLLESINMLFTDASDFTFAFVGDVSDRQMMHSVEETIELLGHRRSTLKKTPGDDFYIARYDQTKEVTVPMNSPRVLGSYKITFPSQFTMEERIGSRIAAKIIEREAVRTLAENGIIATASGRFIRYPQEAMTLELRFEAGYPSDLNLEFLFSDILKRLSVRKVSAAEIKIIRDNIKLREKYQAEHNSEYWLRVLRSRYLDRKDFHSRRDAALDAVTAADIEKILKQCTEEGVVSLISVIPEK